MSDDMQEYMLSHCQAIKTAKEALEGWVECIDKARVIIDEYYDFLF